MEEDPRQTEYRAQRAAWCAEIGWPIAKRNKLEKIKPDDPGAIPLVDPEAG